MGDIPAPIVVGALKDTWAPQCGSVKACCEGNEDKNCNYNSSATCDGQDENWESVLNPLCHEDNSGLRRTLFAAVLWLAVAIISWGILLLWKCGEKVEDEEEDSSSEEEDDRIHMLADEVGDDEDGDFRKTE